MITWTFERMEREVWKVAQIHDHDIDRNLDPIIEAFCRELKRVLVYRLGEAGVSFRESPGHNLDRLCHRFPAGKRWHSRGVSRARAGLEGAR